MKKVQQVGRCFSSRSVENRPEASVLKSDLDGKIELEGISDISGKAEWFILTNGELVKLQESEVFEGVDTPILEIKEPGVYANTEFVFKVFNPCTNQSAEAKIMLSGVKPKKSKGLKVTPNPSDGIFKVHCKNVKVNSKIQIFNQAGQLVDQKELGQLNGNITHQF